MHIFESRMLATGISVSATFAFIYCLVGGSVLYLRY
nr:MAG TPA: hypothetical protein [Caudoviricetes sp.]